MTGKVTVFEPDTKPADSVSSVTPSDTDNLTNTARSLYVGGGGAVRLMTPSSTVATFTSVVGGSIIPVRTIRVFSSATTATNILALW